MSKSFTPTVTNTATAFCLMKIDAEPTFVSDQLVWNGKYYPIGDGHKEFTTNKFNDEDYYVLTLVATTRELKREQMIKVRHTSLDDTIITEILKKGTADINSAEVGQEISAEQASCIL